jgi:predicted helicase
MEDFGVSFLGLTELEEFQDWPAKLTDLRPAKPPKPKKPWDYQRQAINDVVGGFNSADRGQLIMACASVSTRPAAESQVGELP